MAGNQAIANFLFKGLVYTDATPTNNPKQRFWDYEKQLNIAALSNPDAPILTCPQGNTTVTLPATTCNYLYLEPDAAISIKLSGSNTTDAQIVANGFLFLNGPFTGLVINNTSITPVNVRCFIGA